MACFISSAGCRVPIFAAALAAGIISDWATYAMTSVELAAVLRNHGSFWGMFAFMMAVFVPTQIPLGIAEGVVTALAYRFVLERRPDLLGARSDSHDPGLDVPRRRLPARLA